jgi:hypothetical protein
MYFKDEASVESVDEQINRVKEQVKKEMKELNSGAQKEFRRKEVIRAREAALFFDAKKNVWNEKHDIIIKGYDVEIYVLIFIYNGVEYMKDDENNIYEMETNRSLGVFNTETNEIDFV